jgi:hypothetical protein
MKQVKQPHVTKMRIPMTSPKLLHPAFDVRNDVVSVGFSVEGATDEGRKTAGSLFVASVGGVADRFGVRTHDLNGRTLRYWEPIASLPRLEDHWSAQDVHDFVQTQQCLDGRQLYDRHVQTWQRHVDFDERGKHVIAVCWGVMTYVYPLFPAVPYLHFLGAKGTGKSQALDLLQQLARHGDKSRITAPALGDLIEAWRVTPLYDQADNMSLEHVDLFADSYRAGARRAVVDMDRRGQPFRFETFGPKALAGTRFLNEDLADRVIVIGTSPAGRQLPQVRPGDDDLRQLRWDCYRWALRQGADVRKVRPLTDSTWPGLAEFADRQRELWLPIECIMEALDVPEDDRDAARKHYRRSRSATVAELPEQQVELLRVLRAGVGEEESWKVESKKLLPMMGPDTTPQGLGVLLRTLGVLSKEPKRTAKNRGRIYIIDGEVVRSLCNRYGITE